MNFWLLLQVVDFTSQHTHHTIQMQHTDGPLLLRLFFLFITDIRERDGYKQYTGASEQHKREDTITDSSFPCINWFQRPWLTLTNCPQRYQVCLIYTKCEMRILLLYLYVFLYLFVYVNKRSSIMFRAPDRPLAVFWFVLVVTHSEKFLLDWKCGNGVELYGFCLSLFSLSPLLSSVTKSNQIKITSSLSTSLFAFQSY